MPITYTWEITRIKVKDINERINYIVRAHWKKIGVDDSGNIGECEGTTEFRADLDNSEFIPFEQLREEDVINFVKEKITDQYEEQINNSIQVQIDEKISPMRDIEMPWVN